MRTQVPGDFPGFWVRVSGFGSIVFGRKALGLRFVGFRVFLPIFASCAGLGFRV